MLILPIADQAKLAVAVDAAVSAGLTFGGALGRRPKTEPEAVLAVFSTLASAVSVWRAILAPHGVSVGMQGAFIHGAPIVDFKSPPHLPPGCELGDLLLVVDDVRTGSADRRASIIQAKPLTGSAVRPRSASELKQLQLNMTWPVFTFRTPGYGSNPFDLRDTRAPGHVGDSSRYGAVDILSGTWEQLVSAPTMPIGSGVKLGTFASQMVVGTAGRQAVYPAKGHIACSDDWSELVRLLLRNSEGRITSARMGDTDRTFSSFLYSNSGWSFVIANDLLGVDGGWSLPPDDYEFDHEDWEGGGLNTFRITIGGLEGPLG